MLHSLLWLLPLAFSTGDSLSRAGNLPDALPLLMEEAVSSPSDPWLLYRLAWTANRMEMPEKALEPALAAWSMEPSSQWFLAEYLRALRSLGMFPEMMEYSDLVRGGGVCRYYLAAAERELGMEPSPSLRHLLDASVSPDDSTAADACAWLAIFLQGPSLEDSILALTVRSVELRPEEDFYRCLLAERLAEAGDLEGAGEQIGRLRLGGADGYSYWRAVAVLAAAEDDPERNIWALRRARERRVCPESARNLGWALYFRGRNALRSGDLALSGDALRESSLLGDSSEVFVQRSDSLLRLIDEFEKTAAGGG